MRPRQAHCHLGRGKLYCALGRREQARAELNAATDLYLSMEKTFWLPEAEADLAQLTAVSSETPTGGLPSGRPVSPEGV